MVGVALLLVFLSLASGAAAEDDSVTKQVWDLGTLSPGRVYSTTATAVNKSCPGKHDFEVTVVGTPWFRITGPKSLRKIGRGKQQTTDAEVDTRGLAPGEYKGHLKIRCVTCPPPPKCVQNATDLEIHIKIPTDEERYDPVPGGKIPPAGSLCGVLDVEGRFEPTQGVWQDDPVFPDQPGKQLRQLNPRLLHAELAMVRGRISTLFGTIRPVGGQPEDRRGEIFLRGKTDGTRNVPVKIQVTLIQSGGREVVWTDPKTHDVPIGAPCKPGNKRPFEVKAAVGSGLGEFGFGAGGYILESELVQADGSGTGIRSRVIGSVVETQAPRVLFYPVTVAAATEAQSQKLFMDTEDLERRSAREIPDWFPLRHISLVTRTQDVLDFQPELRDREAINKIVRRFRPRDRPELARLILRESMTRRFKSLAQFGGFDRAIVTLGAADFRGLRSGVTAKAVAFTNSRKVSFLDLGVAPFTWTVGHELSHTLPFPWTSAQVKVECRVDYHDKLGKEAHGVRLRLAGEPSRARQDGVIPMIAQATRARPWITQCTYWHHLKALAEGPPDPPVHLVQGYVGAEEGETGGALLPAYEIDALVDLEEGDGGSWALRLLDEGGEQLARFPFEPEWTLPDTGEEKPVASFALRLPEVAGTSTIELEGPGGAVDSLAFSAHAPEVEVLSPGSDGELEAPGGRVRLEWTGTDADGDSLLYTVLHSDDGTLWADLLFESEATAVEIPVNGGGGEHRVRVIATDGARSGEAGLRFTVGGR